MRRWIIEEPDNKNPGSSVCYTLTEDDVIRTFWPFWEKEMIRKYGEDSELITKHNCIQDWITVNYAIEVKDDWL